MTVSTGQLAVALALAVASPSLAAQQTLDAPEMPSPDRLSAGLSFGLAYPQGEFNQLSGVGWELSGHLLIDLDRAGWAGLRLAGTGSIHPERAVGTPVAGVGRLSVRNRLGSLSVGPQLTISRGTIRPYGYGTIGLIFVDTDPSLGGTVGSPDVAGYADITHVTTLGGGLYIPVSSGRRTFALDFGVQYRWNGDTRFVGQGGLTPTPTGGIIVDPLDVSADLLVVRFGVAVWL